MSKFCPKCGEEIKENTKFCGKCGTEINDSPQVKIHQLPKENGSKKSIIIILVFIVIVLVFALSFFAFLPDSSGEKILTSGDLQLNMTGYDYSLSSNTTTDSGYIEYYDVNGNGDSFTLTIMVVEDTYNVGDVGNLGTSLTGAVNAVAVTKYINGKYYWIQISGGNSEHNTEDYLESIILTQGSDAPVNATSSNVESSSTSSSNDEVEWSETVETGEYDEDGNPIYETHGYSAREDSQYGRGYYSERWSANGPI